MDMLCTFIKEPNVVLLFIDCIKKYKIDFPHVFERARKQLFIVSRAQVDRVMCRLLEGDPGDGRELRDVFKGDAFQSGGIGGQIEGG